MTALGTGGSTARSTITVELLSRANSVGGAFSNGANAFEAPISPVFHGVSAANQIYYSDVNGDGRADAIYFDTYRSNGLWIALSQGRTGFSAVTQWTQLQGPSRPTQLQWADVNADGRADLLYFDAGRTDRLLVGISNGVNGFSTPVSWLQHGPSSPDQMQFADVNGDGRADALYFDTSRSNAVWVSLSTGSGFTAPSKWLQHGPSTPAQIQYRDVTGDGKADALYFDTSRSNAVWVSLSTGSSFGAPANWLQHGPSLNSQLQYADVNADGRADALYFDTSRSNAVWVSLSTGSGFTAPSKWLQHGPSTPAQIQYRDVTGDGKADALYFETSQSNAVWASISTGAGFTAPAMWYQLGASTPDQAQYADIDGDHRADLLYFDSSLASITP
jgi:hypothetical protein